MDLAQWGTRIAKVQVKRFKMYSLINIRQIYIFLNYAIKWRIIVCWFLDFYPLVTVFGCWEHKIVLHIKKIFPNGPPMEFLFTLWYPKRSKNNYRAPLQNIFSWPILHSSMDIVEKDFENALFSIYILLITLWCRKMLRKLLKEGTYSREEIIPGSTVGRILSRK